MAKSNTKISYEKKEDILSLWRGNPSKVSVEVGDFIIDVDSRGFISGLEILNASKNLNMNLGVLEKIESLGMSVTYKPNYVHIMLSAKLKGKDKEVSIPLTVDLGHKKVEQEKVAFLRN